MEDHARGIDLVIKKGQLGECYNIGGINEWANIDIVKLICDLMNETFTTEPGLLAKYPLAKKAQSGQAQDLITFVTDRAGHDRRYAINPDKSMKELGYQPLESFESGIQRTLIWYLNNNAWWQAIFEGQ